MSVPSGQLHATAVSIDGFAVLLTGQSGSGKSDLALRLIDRGGKLIADDRTIVEPDNDGLRAKCPEAISGKLEVRGIGIVAIAAGEPALVKLIVELDRKPERMPPPGETRELAGISIPVMALDACEPSAPIKVELALRRILAEARAARHEK